MAYSIREVTSQGDYNPLSLRGDAAFTQGFEYGSWQEKMGRKAFRFVIEKDGKIVGAFQTIRYPLIRGKYYLYIPHGPVLTETSGELAAVLKATLLDLCKKENAVFARFDLFPKVDDKKILSQFTKSPYASYFSAYFQSKYDWVLDISKGEEELLGAMHSKTRYSITLAQKKGIVYETISGAEMTSYFELFYTLMQETAARGKFSLHPKKYYEIIFEAAKTDSTIALYIARFENEVLAAHLMIFYGDTAFYPFGASTNKERNRMPTYGLHWNAIRDGKARGCTYYNFGAIEASDMISHDNWQGISAYKRKFGGSLLEYSDFYDVVANGFYYHLYNLRKKIKKLF